MMHGTRASQGAGWLLLFGLGLAVLCVLKLIGATSF